MTVSLSLMAVPKAIALHMDVCVCVCVCVEVHHVRVENSVRKGVRTVCRLVKHWLHANC